uniref:Selenoprotein F n=1 Tax=Glossina palpalis gambiensis TaxID=67801 RepID=A0A1B0BS91_9MUSC
MLKYLCALLLLCISYAWSELTTQGCRELGFIKNQLIAHCRECCTLDQLPAAHRRYPMAILEVCTCKFRAYPQIQAFIKSGRPAKFRNLTIRYVRGLDPIIKLLDSNGNVKETLSITKWNTDTVEEFFETHLEKHESLGNKQSFSVIEEEDDDDDFLKSNLV